MSRVGSSSLASTSSLASGASTEAKQDIGNASLASIDTKIDALTTPSDTQPVSAASLPLPTGASTAANQTTIIGHLDGVEGLLTTIDADTGNISTKIDTLAGAVSGTEMQVDVLTMPTTTVQATNLDIRDLTSASDSVTTVATTYSTSTVTSVAGSASSVQLLASTAGRKGAYFYNDSSAICYVKLGTTASSSDFTVAMAASSFYELPQPCYTGKIDAIWASATGNMRITEIT